MYPLTNTILIFEKLRNGSKNDIKKNFLNCINKNQEDIQVYLWNNYKNLKIKNKYIDFLSIVKDGEFFYKNIFPKIHKDICKHINARFFIYENNSTDNTKEILRNLGNNKDIFVKSEDLNVKNLNRIEKIKIARNRLSKFYKEFITNNGIGGEWLFLYDTDILFNYETTIKPLIEAKKNTNALMFLTYTVFAGYNEKLTHLIFKKNRTQLEKKYINLMIYFYYDTLALNYGDFFLKQTYRLFKTDKTKVQTGFGGLGMINTIYYLTSYYDIIDIPKSIKNQNLINNDFRCEHWGFCKRLNKFGNLYIDSKSQSLWYQDKDYSNDKFMDYVYFFIMSKNLNNIV